MMYSTYGLFVIWSNYYKGGLGIIQQEFYTSKECEIAKNTWETVAFGCFKI